MSLPHAILGFLSWKTRTGYELKTQAFDGSVAYFWPADQAQIYRTLDKLTEQGWLESTLEVQTERPNRKVYAITTAGRAELRRWLLTEQDLPMHREPVLIQLFFAGAEIANADVSRLLEAQLALHEERLAVYRQIAYGDCDDPLLLRCMSLEKMTLDLGIRLEQTYIDWLRACLATLPTVRDLHEVLPHASPPAP
jgi:PadR family transcriptional regulator, regulatory protein AphA